MWNSWLIYDREGAKRNQDYIQYHVEAGKEFDIMFTLIMEDELEFPLKIKPDFAIVRTIRPKLSKKLEAEGVPVFNNSQVSEICNDKGKTVRYIKENTTVPVLKTIAFSNDKLTKDLIKKHPNHVIKAVDGHGGKQVFQTEDSFEKISAAIDGSNFILQPFLKGPGKDVRVYVIGNEIIGAVERVSADGFKSNFSLGGLVRNYCLSEKEKELVKEICRIFSFGMVGIDFLVDEEENFVFNEIEDVVGARMLFRCQPEVKLLERYFSFILDKMLQNH